MKAINILKVVLSIMVIGLITSCSSSKRGCPSTSATMGAERVLSGEKPEKKSKFKIKGIN